MPPWVKALVLGLVQGLTEFLPVSSSGHLVVLPYLFSWDQPPVAFDVALHLGTLVAVIVYFAGDLAFLATRLVGRANDPSEIKRARTAVGLLAVGSVPAALAGFLLEDQFEQTFADPRFAGTFLLVTGALLVLAERVRRRRVAAQVGAPVKGLSREQRLRDPGRHEGTTSYPDALTIGIAQAFAILPGISRSGATIVAGMLRGLSREGAARFSFLLSIPVILGATVFKLGDLTGSSLAASEYGGGAVIVGMIVAALSGLWAIRFLLRLVATEDLLGFARWVTVVGVLTWVGYLWIGPVSQV